ncbi:MAG TPA: protein TolQ [Pseudobdellovibrionaceae bacterium]|jgi:biopolymer transport protein TolQ
MNIPIINIANAASNTQVAINTSPMDALTQASPVVQLTLLILVSLSIFCWAIAYSKYKQLQQVRAANEHFTTKFWKVNSLDTLYGDIDEFPFSNMARIFKSAYIEMKKLADSPLVKNSGEDKPQLSGLDNLERAIRKSTENEVAKLETRLTVLATTGSTGPFIGLFGTVWGIMGSFHKIGATGNASLAVVAPGISEALIATAIGLAAAIPAVILYNNFVGLVRREEIELNNFSADFLNIVKRNFFKGD